MIIYGFSAFFGGMAIVFNSGTMLSSFIIFGMIIVGMQLIAELAGVAMGHQPILNRLRRILGPGKVE